MAIKVQIHDCSARTIMPRRFDSHMYRDFKNAYTPLFDNATVNEIEVDFSKVVYIDSAALGMLIQLHESAKAVGKPVVLLNPSGVVLRVFDIANLGSTFNTKHTALPHIKNRRILDERRVPEAL